MVSSFSGAGGSCLGFEWAGYEVLWASEFVEAAREVYRLNHPGVPVDERDIRKVTAADVLKATGLREGELDVFEGSPPCASFSMAGKREKAWGEKKKYSETSQVTDDLFFEYARILDGLAPRAFVAENVTGLVRGQAFGYFKAIIQKLRECGPGYRVIAFNLDASWLGVPQRRKRIVFVGVRADLEKDPVAPKPLSYQYSIADALPWLGESRVIHDTSGAWSSGDVTEKPAPTFTVGIDGRNVDHFGVHPPPPDSLLEGTAIGREAKKLRPGQQSERYFNLIRPRASEPSPTITQTAGQRGAAGVIHPTEPRKFTIQELRRLSGFPDDFELTGTYRQQWERLARAVPPPMMRAVAETLRDEILT